MMYFLDFDRTLFDTDAFIDALPDIEGFAPYAERIRAAVRGSDSFSNDKGEQTVWQNIYAALQSGTLAFPQGALEQFVYKDTREFLRALGNEAVIITFGNPVWQKAKIENALAGSVRITALYTGRSLKAEYLKSWPGYYGQEAVYTDDRVHELEPMAVAFPALRLFEMRRDKGAGDGRWPVVHSLSELP